MQHSLESVWEHREEVIYPQLFGPLSRGVFPLDHELFSGVFKVNEADPRWPHYGVHEYGPTQTRRSWIYVTTGFSNPWEDEPNEYSTENFSGFGSELVLETPDQSDWAIAALRKLLAYNILLAHGHYGEPDALDVGSRIPLGGPINGDPQCKLKFLIGFTPRHYDSRFVVASGKVDFLHMLGITESERDYARDHDTNTLIDTLEGAGASPVTNPARGSVV